MEPLEIKHSTLEIAPAIPAQAEDICNVLRRSIVEVCGPDYNNGDSVLSEWLQNKTPENIRNWIKSEQNYSVVTLLDAGVVGFALLRESEILLNYLLPEALGRGIGGKMLAALENEAVKRGIGELTCCSTITAKGFYERHGFRPAGKPIHVGGIPGDFPMYKVLAVD